VMSSDTTEMPDTPGRKKLQLSANILLYLENSTQLQWNANRKSYVICQMVTCQ